LKKIDSYTIKGFIGPYVVSFFIAEFVLVMQFLWKYIDDIIGKSVSLPILLELIFYFAITIIPMAIPLTVLISSVMVFGNMGERYELSSMKSAGVSLLRIMVGGIIISILTACLSLFASNYLKPKANEKFWSRLISIKKSDATLNLEEGVFEDDFKNFVIRVGEKEKDGRGITDVMMYDHSNADRTMFSMIKADEGEMYSTDNNFFVLELEDGQQYRDVKQSAGPTKKDSKKAKFPFMRTEFSKWSKAFDMSEFGLETDANLSRKQYDFMNAPQLMSAIDSVDDLRKETRRMGINNFDRILNVDTSEDKDKTDDKKSKPNRFDELDETIKSSAKRPKIDTRVKRMDQDSTISQDTVMNLLALYTAERKKKTIKSALSMVKNKRDRLNTNSKRVLTMNVNEKKYKLRLHQQFSWALICIVFLFIGAPLGSIVRKGGYGYPLLIAIIFFMLFIIMNIMGERLNRSDTIDAVMAAWMPNLVLIPFAIYFTVMALRDKTFAGWVTSFLNLPVFNKLKKL